MHLTLAYLKTCPIFCLRIRLTILLSQVSDLNELKIINCYVDVDGNLMKAIESNLRRNIMKKILYLLTIVIMTLLNLFL